MTITDRDIWAEAERIVRNEVHLSIGHFVETLSKAYTGADDNGSDLFELTEQAYELAAPIDDWREAGQWHIRNEMNADELIEWCEANASSIVDLENGGTRDAKEIAKRLVDHIDADDDEAWRAFCDDNRVDPNQIEPLEYWAISDYLADRLTALGEKCVKDFGNLTVWARTTSGQGIAADGVFQQMALVDCQERARLEAKHKGAV